MPELISILLIALDESIVNVFAELFGSGYKLSVVESKIEALYALRHKYFNIIVLDSAPGHEYTKLFLEKCSEHINDSNFILISIDDFPIESDLDSVEKNKLLVVPAFTSATKLNEHIGRVLANRQPRHTAVHKLLQRVKH